MPKIRLLGILLGSFLALSATSLANSINFNAVQNNRLDVNDNTVTQAGIGEINIASSFTGATQKPAADLESNNVAVTDLADLSFKSLSYRAARGSRFTSVIHSDSVPVPEPGSPVLVLTMGVLCVFEAGRRKLFAAA